MTSFVFVLMTHLKCVMLFLKMKILLASTFVKYYYALTSWYWEWVNVDNAMVVILTHDLSFATLI